MLDEYDDKTLPLLGSVNLAFVGQVIANQARQIALVAKCGKNDVDILILERKKLCLIKLSKSVLESQWKETDYPFDKALAKFAENSHMSMSKNAEAALIRLQRKSIRPKQYGLF